MIRVFFVKLHVNALVRVQKCHWRQFGIADVAEFCGYHLFINLSSLSAASRVDGGQDR